VKVAIPSNDRSTIAAHFGRTAGFLIYDVADRTAEFREYRTVDVPHDTCACADERPVRHQRVLDALSGCQAVIGRGMGAHMYDDLLACGIDVTLSDVEDARAAIELFVERALPERPELGCEPSR